MRYTLEGLVAYYHINNLAKNLAKNLCNTSKPGNIEKSLMLMRMCKEYEKALQSCNNMLRLGYARWAGMAGGRATHGRRIEYGMRLVGGRAYSELLKKTAGTVG